MSMAPLQSRAIHWTTEDIVGMHCIRFSPVYILKARVLGVRVICAAHAAANARVWLWLSLTPNPRCGYLAKWLEAIGIYRSYPKLSPFSCPPSFSSLTERSGSKLDARNSSKSGQSFHVTATEVPCHYHEYHSELILMTSQDSPCSISEVRHLAQNWHYSSTFIWLIRQFNNV